MTNYNYQTTTGDQPVQGIKIVGHKLDVAVANSNQTKCEPREKNLDETLFKDDDFSVPHENLLKCLYCEKTFVRECHRTLHHKIHTGDKLFKRPLGQQKFVYRSSQKICEVTCKGKKSIYKCSYCEKGFSRLCWLKIHERIHTGEKPFKCSFCSTRFNSKGHLQSHERSHSAEKPFKCSICNSRFNQCHNLRRHERTHTGEKPFKCSFCNSRFNQGQHLRRHETTHTGEKPFKRSYCNSRFKHSISLKRHEKIHTGEKPFKCSNCNARFHSSSNLSRHERTHTGEKPFKCSFCNNRFNTSGNLKRHERNHSGEKPFKISNQKDHQEQVSSLISKVGTQKEGSLGHLKHQEQMHSTSSIEFKCSFCEMIFSHYEERANHEEIHRREDEIVNENFIVGI